MQRLCFGGGNKQRSVFVFAIALLCSLAGCSQDGSTTGEYIVFSSNRAGTQELYIIKPNGTGLEMVPAIEGFKKEPCLSIDGFIVYQTVQRHIRRVDMDGNNDVFLARGHAAEWSPDGQHIVFETNDRDICRMDRDGENIINLTNSPDVRDMWPKWSSDGQRILYLSEGRLWEMNADGSGKSKLNEVAVGGGAEWSPDGRQIAYTSYAGQRRCVFIMYSDGTDVRQLTMEYDEGYGDSEVTWSPNGKRLLFMRLYVVSYSDDGSPQELQSDLCVLDLESGSVTHITTGPETDMCPSWKRVRKPPDTGRTVVGY